MILLDSYKIILKLLDLPQNVHIIRQFPSFISLVIIPTFTFVRYYFELYDKIETPKIMENRHNRKIFVFVTSDAQ